MNKNDGAIIPRECNKELKNDCSTGRNKGICYMVEPFVRRIRFDSQVLEFYDINH